MKTIGMLGGMSWESSAVYYQLINREVQKRLGGVHSAKALMYSFDFGEIEKLQQDGRWAEATKALADVGAMLAKSGSDFVIICCNTMHRMSAEVEKAAGVPLLTLPIRWARRSSATRSAKSG
ncbi:MAG TPA: aspartate/glutamate racemase family protein [Rhizomicrobium sp.]|nr:aspartate/glutamate racemase family protein [Rhizomicrobium sp.]